MDKSLAVADIHSNMDWIYGDQYTCHFTGIDSYPLDVQIPWHPVWRATCLDQTVS